MLRQILVPIDGSELSERALAPTQVLARALGAQIVLVRVLEPPTWVGDEPHGYLSPELYQQLTDSLEEDARHSLEALSASLTQQNLAAKWTLLSGTPAAGLLDFEAETRPDLIVMATHGRSGLARFALGSVADRLIREGTAPVLLVRPFTDTRRSLETALLPLDGSSVAEAALPVVEELAGKPLRAVRLLRAVESADEGAEAERYLQRVSARLGRASLQVTSEIRVAEPARAIEEAATGVDLVVIATHGRGGLDRLRHGSVADQATRGLEVPVLLIRAGTEPESSGGPGRDARKEVT